MEETISLQEIIEVIKKHMKLIASVTIGAIIIAAIVSYIILTPIYESSTQFIVNDSDHYPNQEAQIDSGVIRTNVELINTYNVIITSNAVLDDVIENLNLTYNTGILKDKISVSSEENSQVVTVTVKDPDPYLATEIANEVVAVFQQLIPEIMNVDNVKVLTEAETADNPSPVEPRPSLNMAIAFVLGLMVGIGIAFLIEYLDTKVRKEKDITDLGLTVVGTVYTMSFEDFRETVRKEKTEGIKGV